MSDNEVRLIDAGKLIGYLHKKTFIDGDDRSMVYKAIEEQPTVEAQPVKHGRWKLRCYGDYPYCSNCNNEPKGREMTLHCPNCGVRMDGESK